MLVSGATSKNCATTMNLRRIIQTDITASAVAHLALLALLLLFSEVHRFGEVTAETVAVDIVTPQEIAEKAVAENKPEPAPTPTPQLDFSLLDKPAAASTPAPASQPAAPARPQKQAAVAASRPAPAPAPSPPQAPSPPEAPSPPQAQTAAPAYAPPQPDLSIKYHVMLGLPPDMSPMPPPARSRSGAKAGDDFDAPAIESADIGSSPVTEFRRHLRTCSKLPADLKASDDVKVKLRVFMTRDGRLATDPVLIEASASAKGPLLMQGAISALQACQPYAMLPVDRYGEWKVLDLSFTPQDFSGS
jgi:outer membrane biosynthesis protein TonB